MQHFSKQAAVILCAVFFPAYSCLAQNESYADSLKSELKHAEGKHYIEISNNLCRYYMNSDPDLALSI